MSGKWKSAVASVGVLATVGVLAGCVSDADTVSYNLSQSAEMFEVERRVVFFNGITDSYLLSIEGRCSIEDQETQLEVTCKIGPEEYVKHFLGLSDNVSYFVEQLDAIDASEYNYRVIFKPESIIPNIDPQISGLDTND